MRNGEGIVRASLDTDDPAVREWAEHLHARYWDASTPVTAADLQR